jgi:hypothetical protein
MRFPELQLLLISISEPPPMAVRFYGTRLVVDDVMFNYVTGMEELLSAPSALIQIQHMISLMSMQTYLAIF